MKRKLASLLAVLLIISLSFALFVGCDNAYEPQPEVETVEPEVVEPEPEEVEEPEATEPEDNEPEEGEEVTGPAPYAGTLILATTTSTYDAGLLYFLLPEFTYETGWEVQIISVGTGAAMQLGRDAEADVLLVHARAMEDQFVEDGYAERRYDIMYNDFIVVGPADGPISHNTPIEETFRMIFEDNLDFISRGDDSGTHARELALWEEFGFDPSGDSNYIESGSGMGATLTMAIEMESFTLTDRATWLNLPDHGDLVIVSEGEPPLLNPYGIIIVSTTEEPEGSRIFVDWMIGTRGQYLIGQFGVAEFGSPLFFPEA